MLFPFSPRSLVLPYETKKRSSFGVPRDCRRRKPIFLPQLEQLEDRMLLSITVEAISKVDPKRISDTGALASFNESISADGRFVAFESEADNLVPGDNNGLADVFVRDTLLGTTTLVSVNASGTGSCNGKSRGPKISTDGRFVAFSSVASNLAPGETRSNGDVYLRDLLLGTTTLVSVNAAGKSGGNAVSASDREIVMTPDARFIAFTSYASDLAGNVTSFSQNIYLRDMAAGTTTLVTTDQTGTQSGNGFSYLPALSANGRTLVFTSYANNLVANDGNGAADVFAYDLPTGSTSLVSINAAGTGSGNAQSNLTFVPGSVVSSDGRYVAFSSYASDLVASDTNSSQDVFVRDLIQGTTRLVSANASGTGSGSSASQDATISADGSRVAFATTANDLTTGVTGNIDVRDLTTQTTTVIDVSTTGGQANGRGFYAVICGDGNSVAFVSRASNLIATDDQGADMVPHVYIRNLGLGRTAVVDANQSNTGPSDFGTFDVPVLTPDGGATTRTLSSSLQPAAVDAVFFLSNAMATTSRTAVVNSLPTSQPPSQAA